jgi:hypothetical protein
MSFFEKHGPYNFGRNLRPCKVPSRTEWAFSLHQPLLFLAVCVPTFFCEPCFTRENIKVLLFYFCWTLNLQGKLSTLLHNILLYGTADAGFLYENSYYVSTLAMAKVCRSVLNKYSSHALAKCTVWDGTLLWASVSRASACKQIHISADSRCLEQLVFPYDREKDQCDALQQASWK